MGKIDKDAFYFPHFSNARHDRKLKRVRKDLGLEGYGIFFILLEVLREQTDFKYPFHDIDLLSDEIGTSTLKIEQVITQYDLFLVDDSNNFFSPKFLYYLQPYLEKKERARTAANKRWGNIKKNDANALPENCNSNANQMQSKVNESKVNESKVNESKVNFNLQEIINFYQNNGFGTGVVNGVVLSDIEDCLIYMEKDLIIEAMKKAVFCSKLSWNYVQGILKNWHNQGFSTISDLRTYERKQQLMRENNSNSNNVVSNEESLKKQVEEFRRNKEAMEKKQLEEFRKRLGRI